MASTLTPNMNLIVPTVGQEFGPTYAFDVNASLSLVDQHNHTSGNGVQVPTAGLNINTSLPFNGNFATTIAGVTFAAQSVTPSVGTIYESGNDLFFVDGVGNNVRITQSGGVAGTPGSIANLVPPASASYVSASSTFVWQSNTSIAANMDFGSAILRNLTPNSTFGLTLQPPALSSNYSITLPTLPPAQQIMTLDNAGNMAAPYTVDGTTIAITSNVIGVPAGGIGTTQLANGSVTNQKLAALNIITSSSSGTFQLGPSLSGSFTSVTNLSVSITTSGRPIYAILMSDNTNANGSSINASGSGQNQISLQMLRDGTTAFGLSRFELIGSGSLNSFYAPSAYSAIDVPAAGTHTYALQVTGVVGSPSTGFVGVTDCVLVVYEL